MKKFLRHVKIVDLKHSKLDRGKCDFANGIYAFFPGGKKYITYLDNSVRPEHKLKFMGNTEYDIAGAKSDGWDFVLTTDPYFPEGAILNAEKHWQFHDMVLMKTKLESYLDTREEALVRSQRAAKSRREKFDQHVVKEGGRPFTKQEQASLVEDTPVEIVTKKE